MCFGSFRAQNCILKHPVAYFWRKSQNGIFPCQKCHFLAKFSFIFWLPGELWEGLQRFIVVFGSFYYRNRILQVKVDLKPTGFVLKMFLCCAGWSKTFLPPPEWGIRITSFICCGYLEGPSGSGLSNALTFMIIRCVDQKIFAKNWFLWKKTLPELPFWISLF